MSVATGTAVAIGLGGASIGAQIYGAKKGSDAAKKASEQQAESGREALKLQEQMYQTTRGDLGPYREAGNQSLTALTSFLGLPGMPSGGGAAPAPQAAPAAAAPATRFPHATNLGPAGITPYEAWEQARRQPRTGDTRSAQSFYNTPPGQPPTLGPGRGGGMVTLRAPTGQVQQVPADQVDYYLARGATRG